VIYILKFTLEQQNSNAWCFSRRKGSLKIPVRQGDIF